MTATDDDSLIATFWAARQRGEYFPAALFDTLTLDQAYRIQLALADRRSALGEHQLGWKVAFTSKEVQARFGLDEPVFGCIMGNVSSGHVFAPSDLIKPGFEPELCIRLRHDLPAEVTSDEVRRAVDVVYPSLEIIENRGPFIEQVALAIADNARQKTVVLGMATSLPRTLETVKATIFINGRQVATGLGGAVLGNPLNSVVWLAKKLAASERSLKAGDLIMTGSFARFLPISPGDRIYVSFSGIGDVDVAMSV